MNTIRSWLDKNSDSASNNQIEGAPETPVIVPDTAPTGNLEGTDPFDHPWKDNGTVIVIDAYEQNTINWDKMATDKKVVGIIHRSSIGLKIDSAFETRKKIALERGYLWGAYHLGKRGNTIAQAEIFLTLCDDNTLMALDLEDTSKSDMMSIDEAVVFMDHIYKKTGKICVVYANDSVTKALNEKLSNNAIFKESKLWYARFKGRVTDFPVGIWKKYFLWQFSSEINCSKDGTCLYNVPGTKYNMDINVFFGSKDQLALAWTNEAAEVTQPPVQEPQKETKKMLWFDIAKVEIGQKEVTGPKHNQRILEYHSATSLKATTDEIPWCSSFVTWCLESAGIKSTKNAWARSYLNWGKKIEKPIPGCVTVFKRGTDSGHVAFFVKDNGSTITVLGGNQSNKVCYADYKKSDLLGYRLPDEY